MLEMHHVVAQRERAGDGRGRRLAVAPRAPEPAGPTEDFVIGEDAQGRHHEAAVERPNGERRARGPESVVLEQLVETFALPFIVAQNQRRRAVPQHAAQPAEIPVDTLGREEADLDVRLRVAEDQPREGVATRLPLGRREKEVLARRRVLAEPPGNLEMVFRLAPGAIDLFLIGMRQLLEQERVARQEVEQRAAREPLGGERARGQAGAGDREHGHVGELGGGPLGREVEHAHRTDFVAPPFDPGGAGHAEAVEVDDAAPHRELRHFGHGRHATVAHRFKGGHELAQWSLFPRGEAQSHRLEGSRNGGALGAGTDRGDEHADLAVQQLREGLDPLTGDLEVRLVLSQRFALREDDPRVPGWWHSGRRHRESGGMSSGTTVGQAEHSSLHQRAAQGQRQQWAAEIAAAGSGEGTPGAFVKISDGHISPERPHRVITRRCEGRFPGVNRGTEPADGVAAGQQHVDPRLHRPPATVALRRFNPSVADHGSHPVGQRQFLTNDHVRSGRFAPQRAGEQHVEQRNEPRRERQRGPRWLEAGADQQEVTTAHQPGCAARRAHGRQTTGVGGRPAFGAMKRPSHELLSRS